MEEREDSIHRLKKNKAPGQDEGPMELFKTLDDENLDTVLTLINDIRKGQFLEHMNKANVITLFKR